MARRELVGAAARAGRRSSCCPSVSRADAAARARAGDARRSSSSRARTRACARRSTSCGGSPPIVRDRLSIDTWRILNQLHQDFRLRHGRIQLRRRAGAPEPDDHRPGGVQRHGDGEHDARPRLALPRHRPPARARGQRDRPAASRRSRPARRTSAVLEPLLEIADSSMTYRRRYFARPQLSPVLDLLLVDETNPRALAFQLDAAVGARPAPAARSPGAVADARGAADRSAR